MELELVLYLIKLIIGGTVSFLAILLMSKTRDLEWMFIVASCLFNFFFEVLSLFTTLGLFPSKGTLLISAIHYAIPSILLIVAFIIKLLKRRG